ncbi:MAG TPA: VOC family protein [Stellaceae bacterium]|nr:VOC family protein [Stellaceae bacterium]
MPESALANPIHPLGVGEVVLRVADVHRSISFYRDVLGFPLIRVLHNAIAFIRVADGVAGHTQIIGLFDRNWASSRAGHAWRGYAPESSTLHHFAVEIKLAEYEAVLAYLTQQGLEPNTSTHAWIGWRSIYVTDPDGHTVEFVCYDGSILDHASITERPEA